MNTAILQMLYFYVVKCWKPSEEIRASNVYYPSEIYFKEKIQIIKTFDKLLVGWYLHTFSLISHLLHGQLIKSQ